MRFAAYLTALCFSASMLASCDSMPSWMDGKKDAAPAIEGDRIAVLSEDSELSANEDLKSDPIELAAAEANEHWPLHAGSEAGLATTLMLIGALENENSVGIGEGADFEHGVVVAPIVAAGRVFAMDAEGKISAHAVADIDQELWVSDGVANLDESAMIGGGLAYGSGALFAASGNGLVASFDPASGRELWRQDIRIPVRAPPLVAGSKLYIVTTDSKLFTLDATTGDVIWEEQGMSEGASFLANAAPVYYNGLLAVPYASAELRVVTADEGRLLWSDVLAMTRRNMAASNFSGIGGAPVIINNAVYAVSTAGVLAAYRLDNGLRIWEQPISSTNRPWVSGNVLYVLGTNGQLMGVNRLDGRIYWVSQLHMYENEEKRLYPYRWSGPVLAGEVLYIAGAHGEMKRFNALTGAELDTLEIPSNVLSSPVIAGGRMYLISKDARLHVLY